MQIKNFSNRIFVGTVLQRILRTPLEYFRNYSKEISIIIFTKNLLNINFQVELLQQFFQSFQKTVEKSFHENSTYNDYLLK